MKRRTFVVGTAGSILTASTIGIPFIARAQPPLNVDRSKLTKTMRLSSYGGNWQEGLTAAAIKPFEEKYGVQVLQESHGSEAQLITKMKASGAGAYDVVTVNESGLIAVPGRLTLMLSRPSVALSSALTVFISISTALA